MPYAKPQVLRRGHRRHRDAEDSHWKSVATIREDVGQAASFIAGSLKSRGARRAWSTAEVALDPAGPWWPKPRGDFFELDSESREWAMERLETTADRAAECLQDEAVDRDWGWLWSQPSFAAPGKMRPSITRPDLVGGLDRTRCDVLDLKITSQADLGPAVTEKQTKSFLSWATSLRALGFAPMNCWVLAVSATDERYQWTEFPTAAEDTV
ncbi:hypothetical protein [Spelaeicoccus albus]|uniref:Uncharacterized protein n=2 Tax=Spelaeicoccus albus TaxID=1280376 RepID=A0A7Z0D1H5_9MICO|nr:hypothetical protein [Spelaeicoccus albus]NYI66100.1 hypothetical protein [Spelaeicoccus albus]